MITNETKKRCKFFLDRNTKVHIKSGESFYNGLIKEIDNEKVIFEDRVLGIIPLFFSEIKLVEPYREVGR